MARAVQTSIESDGGTAGSSPPGGTTSTPASLQKVANQLRRDGERVCVWGVGGVGGWWVGGGCAGTRSRRMEGVRQVGPGQRGVEGGEGLDAGRSLGHVDEAVEGGAAQPRVHRVEHAAVDPARGAHAPVERRDLAALCGRPRARARSAAAHPRAGEWRPRTLSGQLLPPCFRLDIQPPLSACHTKSVCGHSPEECSARVTFATPSSSISTSAFIWARHSLPSPTGRTVRSGGTSSGVCAACQGKYLRAARAANRRPPGPRFGRARFESLRGA